MIDNQDVANKQLSSFDQEFHIFLILLNKIASTSKIQGWWPKKSLVAGTIPHLMPIATGFLQAVVIFFSPQTNMPYSHSNTIEFKLL